MKSLVHSVLGADFTRLPAALQAHYKAGAMRETGHMDIEYPRWMQPFLTLLRCFGALVNRAGLQIPTLVEKCDEGIGQRWRRIISYPDGKVIYFNSKWVASVGNRIIEYVNPLLGLEMALHVENDKLYYEGVRFVVKLGRLLVPLPEWLLGHATIVEAAVDDTHFAMDFRLTHPLFGLLFRYAGQFEVEPSA